jgi:hypothetical protein
LSLVLYLSLYLSRRHSTASTLTACGHCGHGVDVSRLLLTVLFEPLPLL